MGMQVTLTDTVEPCKPLIFPSVCVFTLLVMTPRSEQGVQVNVQELSSGLLSQNPSDVNKLGSFRCDLASYAAALAIFSRTSCQSVSSGWCWREVRLGGLSV